MGIDTARLRWNDTQRIFDLLSAEMECVKLALHIIATATKLNFGISSWQWNHTSLK
jgi:hypothetical protein